MMFLINLGTNLFSLRSPCKSGNPHKFGLDVEIDDALPIRSMKMFLICRTEINKLISLLWHCGLNSGSRAWCNKRSTTHLCSQLHNSRRRERRQEKVCVMCVCVPVCHSAHLEVRELPGTGLSFHHAGSGTLLTSSIRCLGDRCL